MSLLQVLPIVKSNVDEAKRYKACLSCPAKQHHLFANWCGKPLEGGQYVVVETGQSVELCGCSCKLKVKVNEEICPLGRW